MNIKTKFDVGDKVWILYDVGAKRLIIERCSISVISGVPPSIWYFFPKTENGKTLKRHEDDCCETLDELLSKIPEGAKDLTIKDDSDL